MAKLIEKLSIITLLAGLLVTPVWAESEEDIQAACEQEAAEAGIEEGEERSIYVQQCIEESAAPAASESNQ
jgi:hypothetical protein